MQEISRIGKGNKLQKLLLIMLIGEEREGYKRLFGWNMLECSIHVLRLLGATTSNSYDSYGEFTGWAAVEQLHSTGKIHPRFGCSLPATNPEELGAVDDRGRLGKSQMIG